MCGLVAYSEKEYRVGRASRLQSTEIVLVCVPLLASADTRPMVSLFKIIVSRIIFRSKFSYRSLRHRRKESFYRSLRELYLVVATLFNHAAILIHGAGWRIHMNLD